MNNVGNTSFDVINRGGGRQWDLAGEPSNSVSDALSLGVIVPDCVTLVGVHGWAKVPAINAMGCPTAVYTGFFMDDDASARWGNGGAVEVKRSMELCPSG